MRSDEHMLTLREPQAHEHGFTLIELLIAIVLMGLLVGAMSSAVITGFRTTDDANKRLQLNQDARLLSAYFTADLMGTQSVTVGDSHLTDGDDDSVTAHTYTDQPGVVQPAGTGVCLYGITPLVSSLWTDDTGTTDIHSDGNAIDQRFVSYYKRVQGSQTQLVRRYCEGAAPNPVCPTNLFDVDGNCIDSVGNPVDPEDQPTNFIVRSDTVLAHFLNSASLPTVSCLLSSGANCAVDTPVAPATVKLTVNDCNYDSGGSCIAGTAYSFSITAARRLT